MTSATRPSRAQTSLDTSRSLVFAAWLVTVVVAVAGALLNGWLGLAFALAGGVLVGVLALRQPTAVSVLPGESSRRSLQPQCAVRPGRGWLYRLCAALDRNELLLIAVVGPLFIFPQDSLVWIAALIPALWLNRLYVRGYVTVHSPLNTPLLLLLLMFAPGYLIAGESEMALSKLMGLLLGIALYMAILNHTSERLPEIAIAAIALLAVLTAGVGYVGTDWPVSGKLPLYADIYRALPRLLHSVRGSTSGGGINPNEMGGTLTWLVPFLAASIVLRLPGRAIQAWFSSALLVIALAVCGVLLLLAQSRGAIFAVISGSLILIAVSSRRLSWALASALLVVVLVLFVRLGIAGIDEVAQPSGTPAGGVFSSAGSAIIGRTAIWQSAAELAHRFPVGGVGLAMFSIVARQLVDPAMAQQTTHAHDELIQSAMDFGLPGLAAYTALLVCAFGLLLRIARAALRGTPEYVLAIALLCGLAAHQIFGLTDVIALGQKPGFIFWIFLGLVAYLARGRSALDQIPGIQRAA